MTDAANMIRAVLDKLKPMFMEDERIKKTTGHQSLSEETTSDVESSKQQNSTVQNHKPSTLEIVVAILNGMGVGLLLGLLLGLAVSPVVSGVIGTLSSLLVVLLGQNNKYLSILKSIRVGTFGLFAVVGVLLGMYIRANDALSPTTEELMAEYTKIGYEKNEALYYVAREKFNYVPLGWFGTSAADTGNFRTGINPKLNVLFSSEVDIGRCTVLQSVDETFPKSELIRAFDRAGGTWKELITNLEPQLPDRVLMDAMIDLRDSFCGLGREGKVEIKSSNLLLSFTNNSNLDEIKNAMRETGENWKVILENTENGIPEEYQKNLYLTLIKTFTHEKNN